MRDMPPIFCTFADLDMQLIPNIYLGTISGTANFGIDGGPSRW